MGIENRDYVRESNRGGGGHSFGGEYPAVRNLILVTVLIFLAQIFFTRQSQTLADMAGDGLQISVAEQWLQLDTNKVIQQGQVWRLLTSAFCHDRYGIWHILINMLLLFWFGRELETIYGSRRFTWFYLTAAIFGSLAFVGIQLATGERNPAIGASGAVMGVMAVYTIFHPRNEVLVFFVIPVQIRFLLLIYVIYDLHPVLLKLTGTPVPTGVAHAAHLGGLAYGLFFWRTGWSLLSPIGFFLPGLRDGRRIRNRKSGNPRPRIIPIRGPFAARPEVADKLDQELDHVLKKISESGQESLNDKEKAILDRASKAYSDRSNE